jgi:Protein of unknown function (DUF4232)
MTGHDPTDRYDASAPSDAFEARLASRVARHAEHGVRPIDAVAIASAAVVASRGGRRSGSGAAAALGRLGWLLAGAALAAGLIGGAMWAGGHDLLGTPVTSPEPTLVAVVPTEAPTPYESVEPTTAPTEPPVPACAVADLSAQVTSWTGAAGNRIATVTLTYTGTTACRMRTLETPQLIDANGTVLIQGDTPSHPAAITLDPGVTVSTEVDDANYCGPAPKAPATVAFVFSGGQQLVAAPRSTSDLSGVPDCLGPTGPGLITMHPWAP